MTSQAIRRLLNGITLAMSCAALATIAWAFAPSVLRGLNGATDDPDNLLLSGRVSQQPLESTDNPSAADDPIWSRPIRDGFVSKTVRPKPIASSRPKPTVSKTPRKSPGKSTGLTLVGTVLEDDQSVAIFSDRSGTLDFRGVGEALNLQPSGVKVQAIRDREVTIAVEGKMHTLSIGREWTTTASSSEVTAPTEPKPSIEPSVSKDLEKQATKVVDDFESEMSIDDELDFLNGDDDDF